MNKVFLFFISLCTIVSLHAMNDEAARAAGDTGKPNRVILKNQTGNNVTVVFRNSLGRGIDRKFDPRDGEKLSYPRPFEMIERILVPGGEFTVENMKRYSNDRLHVDGVAVPVNYDELDDKECKITITRSWSGYLPWSSSSVSFSTVCDDYDKEAAMLSAIAGFDIIELKPDEVYEGDRILSISKDKPYAILNLTPEATKQEVKTEYRKLMRKWHPNTFVKKPEHAALATAVSKHINVAYETITDPDKAKRAHTE